LRPIGSTAMALIYILHIASQLLTSHLYDHCRLSSKAVDTATENTQHSMNLYFMPMTLQNHILNNM